PQVAVAKANPIRAVVWNGKQERFFPLVDSLPLKSGDQMRFEATIPAGNQAVLLLWTSEGHLTELASISSTPIDQNMRFPAEADMGAPLTGADGSDALILIQSSAGKIELKPYRQQAGFQSPWPQLPADLVLAANNQTVDVAQRSKDF